MSKKRIRVRGSGKGPLLTSKGTKVEKRLLRHCGDCEACERTPECGWKQGLLGPLHRPDQWGMRLDGRKLPDGTSVFVFQEVINEVRMAESVRAVLSAIAVHHPIVITKSDGTVATVLGPDGMVEGVVEALGIKDVRIDDTEHELEAPKIPDNPLGR